MNKIITFIDVIRAISEYMTVNYPNYPIDDRDITDTVDRPCTFIDIDDMQSEPYANEYIRDSATINIYIFIESLNVGFLELLHAKNDILQWLMGTIEVKDLDDHTTGYVSPTDVNAEISKADKALNVSFNIELIQQIVDKTEIDIEDMEHLDYQYKE